MEYPELTYEECEYIRSLGRSSCRTTSGWFRYPPEDRMIASLIKKNALYTKKVEHFVGEEEPHITYTCKLNMDHPITPDLLAMDSL